MLNKTSELEYGERYRASESQIERKRRGNERRISIVPTQIPNKKSDIHTQEKHIKVIELTFQSALHQKEKVDLRPNKY